MWGAMKKKNTTELFTKNAITTMAIIAIFILSYVLVVLYTYNRIETMAQDTLLQSAVSSATSFHKIIENDMAQVQYAANKFAEEYPSINDSNIAKFLNTFIDAQGGMGNCKRLMYVKPDGFFTYSDGVSGKVAEGVKMDAAMAVTEPVLADLSTFDAVDKHLAYIYCPVIVNNETVGLLIGSFDYNTVLSETYPSEYYTSESSNLIINTEGQVVLDATGSVDSYIGRGSFFDYLEEHADAEYTFDSGTIEASTAHVVSVIEGEEKYAMAIVKPHDDCKILIVRIIPSGALFAQTGNILVFLTIASLFFFFALMVVAYKFYKTLSASTEKIRSIAYVDPLTGGSNFSKFKEDAKEVLENSNEDEIYYLCCIDMVGFRYINDAFGYDVGDQILVEITENIDALMEEDELFARISGDKFIILTKRNLSDTENELFLHKLTGRICTIQPLAKSHIRLEVQMGVYKILREDIGELSINAMYDRCLVALYSINHSDTDAAMYDSTIHDEQIEKKNIESKMHEALQNGEFRVYVQPKYRTGNAKLAAGEALIRWIDPEKGMIPPIKFIPVFEQNRFVHDIDLYVMEVVSRFIRMRLNDGLPVVPISLNISPVEITMPNFKDAYIDIKEKYNIPDGLIELEFTEGIFFENEEYFRELISEFQSHGFRCSIDDFGSGYSSLNILKNLPVDTLKLDRLFFKESDDTSRDRSIVRSVVAMARSLNIMTVAEGVETLEVVDFLKLIGCTLIQGYVYARPMPLTEFEEKLNTEEIDISTELDYDKFEAIPLDMPLSNSMDKTLSKTYAAICEINAGGNIYHMYYPSEQGAIFDTVPARGFYNSFLSDNLPKIIHEKDTERVVQLLNPINLGNHFKTNKELDFEYKHMRKDGSYSWIKVHIIKATGANTESQIYFAYFNVIDNYKEAEEKLETVQTRFSSAYSNFNGVVFELDIENGQVELLESRSNLLSVMKDVKSYDAFRTFIFNNLLHPDEKERFTKLISLDALSDYFKEVGKNIFSIEILAKPSRKVDYYNYYKATYNLQPRKNKILLTIEDISEQKLADAVSELQVKVTNVAFSNAYHSYFHVCINKDTFELIPYVNQRDSSPNIVEGKYSIYMESTIKQNVKESDRETYEQIFGLKGLEAVYDDGDSRPISFAYQRREGEGFDYKWFEALIIAMPLSFGSDKHVFIFRREIEDLRVMEQNLNEYAHRLSYSLAMFDYAYTVDINNENVDIIGGLCFDTDLLNANDLTYSEITMHIKNTEIDEEDRSSFRRFTYLDGLVEYFQVNPATITKYFAADKDSNRVIEVSVIYGSRENKLTFFIRKLNKSDITTSGVILNDNSKTVTSALAESLENVKSENKLAAENSSNFPTETNDPPPEKISRKTPFQR